MRNIIPQIRVLDLPLSDYCVVSGAVLEIYGIRHAKDIDLLISEPLHKALKARGWREKPPLITGYRLGFDIFDTVTRTWCGDYRPKAEDIISRATTIHGVPVASLQDTRDWKEAIGREIDIQDIKAIDRFLA